MIDAKAIGGVGDLVLVVVTVHIENKGDTRINARRGQDEDGYVYNIEPDADLEQINYLGEFQDPETHFRDVDFWLEPRESYDQPVFLWLRPGIYAAKAYFLGPRRKHQEDEYWSCQTLFNVGSGTRLAK